MSGELKEDICLQTASTDPKQGENHLKAPNGYEKDYVWMPEPSPPSIRGNFDSQIMRQGSLKLQVIIVLIGSSMNTKRGACPVTRSTCWGLRIALPVETSNAESPTKNEYRYSPKLHDRQNPCHTHTFRAVYKHPKGRPRCLVFDWQFEFAKFQHVKTKASRKRLCPWCLSPSLPPSQSQASTEEQMQRFE